MPMYEIKNDIGGYSLGTALASSPRRALDQLARDTTYYHTWAEWMAERGEARLAMGASGDPASPYYEQLCDPERDPYDHPAIVVTVIK